ncbi:MAG TPA: 4-hydroxy-tetrahydrodipicolinate synthase [Nocardioidaceae bacterium]|nr:4-hydroxy-tetrahydrodipicolinate synthase [Nocardioidaceae bacterium]
MGATPAPFGRTLTAMVTPFTTDGGLDVDAAARVAHHLVDHGNDGLVISGTTGESPTTSDEEMGRLLSAVIDAVGDRAHVVAGVGTNNTAHSVHLARQAAKVGASGMLVVTPYYSKPPQAGIVAHMTEIAEAGDLPTMVYDIPSRTGVKLSHETLLRLAAHPAFVAVKEASGDLTAGSWVMRETDLAFYSGDDALNLAWLAHGGVGIVSVICHAAPRQCAKLVDAMTRGDLVEARRIHQELLPVVRAIMTRTQGAIAVKAALQLQGVLANRTTRPPLIDMTESEFAVLRNDLVAAGLL